MMKFKIWFLGIILMGCMISFNSCKEENKSPTCNITSPADGDIITQKDLVKIVVDARDEDGDIVEVNIYINDSNVIKDVKAPYQFFWETGKDSVGSYKIKGEAFDNENAFAVHEINVQIETFNAAPTAIIAVDKTFGNPGDVFNFESYGSNDPEDIFHLQTRWDFDNNGIYEKGWSYEETASHSYSFPGPKIAVLEVKDSGGKIGKAQVSITIN